MSDNSESVTHPQWHPEDAPPEARESGTYGTPEGEGEANYYTGEETRQETAGEEQAYSEEGVSEQHPSESIARRPTSRHFQRRQLPETPAGLTNRMLSLMDELQEVIAAKAAAVQTGNDADEPPSKARRLGFKPAGPAGVVKVGPAPPLTVAGAYHAVPPPPERRKFSVLQVLGMGLVALLLAVGAYFAGRSAVPADSAGDRRPKGFAPPSAAAWEDPALAAFDNILAADRAGDTETALRLANDLKAQTRPPTRLNGYISGLETRRGNLGDAEADLTALSDRDNAMAAEQFAYFYARKREFDKSSDWLRRAVALDPFSARDLYLLGESLRREGKPQLAVNSMRQSLLRLPTETDSNELREQTAFKMRLAQIEAGNAADLQADLESHLKAPPVSGWWLLTAAANSLQAGDPTAAAGWLTKAQGALPPDRFNEMVGDYFFRGYASRKEMMPYFGGNGTLQQRQATSRTRTSLIREGSLLGSSTDSSLCWVLSCGENVDRCRSWKNRVLGNGFLLETVDRADLQHLRHWFVYYLLSLSILRPYARHVYTLAYLRFAWDLL